jgi:hypothetical protein
MNSMKRTGWQAGFVAVVVLVASPASAVPGLTS